MFSLHDKRGKKFCWYGGYQLEQINCTLFDKKKNCVNWLQWVEIDFIIEKWQQFLENTGLFEIEIL